MYYYTCQDLSKNKLVDSYYVVDGKDIVVVQDGRAYVLDDATKDLFLSKIDRYTLIGKEKVKDPLLYKNAYDASKNYDYTEYMGSKFKEKLMNRVRVIPKSDYERDDIETALNDAYDDYGYILDKMIESENYIVLYLKKPDKHY